MASSPLSLCPSTPLSLKNLLLGYFLFKTFSYLTDVKRQTLLFRKSLPAPHLCTIRPAHTGLLSLASLLEVYTYLHTSGSLVNPYSTEFP